MSKRALSFILACVMLVIAVPAAALSIHATEEDNSDAILTDVWTGGEENAVCHLVEADREFFLVWYNGDEIIPVGRGGSVDTSKAKINPLLIEDGIVSADDTVEDAWNKWVAYMKENSFVEYKGNWTVDSTTGSELSTILYYNYYNNRSVGHLWINGTFTGFEVIPLNDPYWITEAGIDRVYAALYAQMISAGAKGDANVSALELSVSSVMATAARPLSYETGAMIQGLNFGVKPMATGKAAYTYTVPQGIYGTATLNLPSSTFLSGGEVGGKVSILVNGEIVWPAGATFADTETWRNLTPTNLASVNNALAEFSTDVLPGTQISVCVAKVSSDISLDLDIALSIERKFVVEYKNAHGDLLTTHIIGNGEAVPKGPYAASVDGWIINGEASDELPATVTHDLSIQYAGDPTIVDASVRAVSISVSSDFSVNLYLAVDEYVTKVSVGDDDGFIYKGVLQPDGTYKVSIPSIPAKDMDDEFNLWLCQEFADGSSYDAAEPYVLAPSAILSAYADSDASEAEKAVAAAALDYAAAAKAYFYGEALSDEVKARLAEQDAAIAEIESDVEAADGKDYFVNGMILVLKDRVSFKVRVASSMYEELSDEMLDFVVVMENQGREEEYSGFVYTEGDEGYSMTMTLGGVNPADFDQAFHFTVKDTLSLPVSETFSYSVNDYIARTFDASAAEADLLRAIYALGVAANRT